MLNFKKILLIGIVFGFNWTTTATAASTLTNDVAGIQFSCSATELATLEIAMPAYLKKLAIAERYVSVSVGQNTLTYTLATAHDDLTTLDFFDRSEYQLHDAVLTLPTATGRRNVATVSQKEILLALLQRGRLTTFQAESCHIDALVEHVGVRQNIVAWAEALEFGWPDGGPAKWNALYWDKGTPVPGVALHAAVNDMFLNQNLYEIGCYTATKMVVIQGVLDYYHRVKPDAVKLQLVTQRLLADGEPLVDIEPGRVWDFEQDFDPKESARPGKLLSVRYGIAPKNFVPGDWAYMLNTDPVTYQNTGYEGSNAIYLGRNRFDDYYNDHEHAYSYRQKLHEVYQWRNNVFSESRDHDKVVPLTARDIEHLGNTPANGGIVLSLRISPYFFGFETLP